MARDQADIASFIVGWLGDQLGYKVSPEAEFTALGLDSLDAVRLTDALSAKLGIAELPVALVFEHASIPKLSGHLATLP